MSNYTTNTVHDEARLQAFCRMKFGLDLDYAECYEIINSVLNMELAGISSCYPQNTEPNITKRFDVQDFCHLFEQTILLYALPLLQIFCLIGNLLNLLIYRLPYFHGASAVYFLRAKAIANMIFVQIRILEVIHAWLDHPDPQFESFFWRTRPYIITIANISGTISTWVTLYITFETLLCVLLPFTFRQYCNRKNTVWLLIASVILSTVLHCSFLYTYSTTTKIHLEAPQLIFHTNSTKSINNTTYFWNTKKSTDMVEDCWRLTKSYSIVIHNLLFEKIYYWVNMILSIVLPTLAMLLCTILIIQGFTFKNLGESFSQRRSCVIRLVVATTLSHLLLEGPALVTFGAVALEGGASHQNNTNFCIFNNANNLLSVLNATIPFYVFIVCNHQFRIMSSVYLKTYSEKSKQNQKRKYSEVQTSTQIFCRSPFPLPPISPRNSSNRSTSDTLLFNEKTNVLKVSSI